MPDNDHKRAEEMVANALTLTDLESIGALSLRKLIDAITTFAGGVRAEQRERDAKIVETEIPVAGPDGDLPVAPFVRAVIAAIRKGGADA